jgi:phosphate transport system protein
MAELAALAQSALERATGALLDPEEHAADQLTAADRELHELLDGIEETAAEQSVADLRALVAGVHLGNELESVADLVRRIESLAWTRHEQGAPLPARLRLPLRALGSAALGLLDGAGTALAAGSSADLSGAFTEFGVRQRRLYRELLADRAENTTDTAEAVLLACHLRHCAEHAVTLAAHAELLGEAAD